MNKIIFVYYIQCHLSALISSDSTFVASFKSDPNLERFNTEKWGKYVGEINEAINFTACHWEKLQFFATEYNPVWAYCIELSSSKSVDGGKHGLSCIQLYTTSDTKTWGSKVNLMGWLEDIEVETTMHNYHHRQWNHICWTYSSLIGHLSFYVNGKLEIETDTKIYNRIIRPNNNGSRSVFIIGQEPDSIGPDFGFEKAQTFLGELTELNMWDRVLDREMIINISRCEYRTKGNLVSWSKI